MIPSDKPTIRVWETESLGLIIKCKSGVQVSNQTGGHGCLHPELEGIYVPLRTKVEVLENYFTGPKWDGWCMEGIDQETADFIDDLLAKEPDAKFISVDRTRLKESHEAWVFVNIREPKVSVGWTVWSGFGTTEGILTWPNSD